MEKKHINILVAGKVQGVWYRGSARQKASQLGLAGFVCNLPDGRVYGEAEGSESALAAFVAWCWQGPELAQVENVTTAAGEWQGFEEFTVRR